MRKIFSKILNLIKKLLFLKLELLLFNIKTIIVFQTVFKIFTVLCALSVFDFLIVGVINICGYSYISDANLLSVITNPLILICFFVLIIILTIYSLFDISAQLYVFEKSRRLETASFLSTIKFGFRNALRVLNPKNIVLYPFLLILTPMFNVGVTSSVLTKFSVPVSYVSEFNRIPYASIFFCVIIIILLILSFKLMFTLQFFTLENNTAFQAFKNSSKLNRKNRIWNFVSMMCIQLLISLVNGIFLYIASSLINITYGLSVDGNFIFKSFVFAMTFLFMCMYFVISSMYLTLSCLKVTSIYYSNKEDTDPNLCDIQFLDPDKRDKVDKSMLFRNYPNIFKNMYEKLNNFSQRSKNALFVSIVSTIVIMSSILAFNTAASNCQNLSNSNTETQVIFDRQIPFLTSIQEQFKAAKNSGSSHLKMNLYKSSDGVLFVLNSDTIYDSLTREGVDISSFTYHQIQYELPKSENYGSIYFKEDSTCLFDDLLNISLENNVGICLNLKNIVEEDLLHNISTKLEQYYISNVPNSNQNIILSSTNLETLSTLKRLNPNLLLAYQQAICFGDMTEFKGTFDYLMIDLSSAISYNIKNLHQCGFGIIVNGITGIDDDARAKELQNYSCEYICSYIPSSTIASLNENKNNEFVERAYQKYFALNVFKSLL